MASGGSSAGCCGLVGPDVLDEFRALRTAVDPAGVLGRGICSGERGSRRMGMRVSRDKQGASSGTWRRAATVATTENPMKTLPLGIALLSLTACTGRYVPDDKPDDTGAGTGAMMPATTAARRLTPTATATRSMMATAMATTQTSSPDRTICDDIDNGCDGAIDDAVDASTWYFDEDQDGHETPSTAVSCRPTRTSSTSVTTVTTLAATARTPRGSAMKSTTATYEIDEDVAPEDADTFYIDADGDERLG